MEKLRERFVTEGFEVAVHGKPRETPATAKRLNGKQEAKLIAMRLGPPSKGYANWTMRLLSRKVVEWCFDRHARSFHMPTVRISLEEVVGYFDELEDSRSTINQKHPFVSIVVIALMAVLAGASGTTTIAQWAKYKEAFLLRVLDLPHGVPRKDVFRRVLSSLHPAAFQTCFSAPNVGLALGAQGTGR